MERRCIAIVGGGPRCTYAVERLAAMIPHAKLRHALRICIFEDSGRFGAGQAHSDCQVKTSYLNRVAGQIAFAADESNHAAYHLLRRELRPTFSDWCQAKFAQTGDERFNLRPLDVPKRYIHGLALREFFDRYVALLRALPNVEVELYAQEVIDVSRGSKWDAPYCLHLESNPTLRIQADYVLFVTGHSQNRSTNTYNLVRGDAPHARARTPRYIPYAYPLETAMTLESVPAGCAIAIEGFGLTAIDVILHLTEGRGGVFEPFDSSNPARRFRYARSGSEPAVIVPTSPSGLAYTCRPVNQKEAVPKTLVHRGVFLTVESIERMRRNFGLLATWSAHRKCYQLDFEKHVFPLVVLEMALLYYRTLFGPGLGQDMRETAFERYETFLRTGCSSPELGISALLEPLDARFAQVAEYVSDAMKCKSIGTRHEALARSRVLSGFFFTLFGPQAPCARATSDASALEQYWSDPRPSPWNHSIDVYAHRFRWSTVLDPLSPENATTGAVWRAQLTRYMEQDISNALQGNLHNPIKAACDGVWRDLRSVLAAAVDHGGLIAASHQRFVTKYLRYYNRLSNGCAIEALQKILALAESGVLDLSIGPNPSIEPAPDASGFLVVGPHTGERRIVKVVVNGKVHEFNPQLDTRVLYANMLNRGLVQQWRNPGENGAAFVPGCLDVSERFHPLLCDGSEDRRLTLLGSPADQVVFFQLAAARPCCDSYVLNGVARWANEVIEALEANPEGEAVVRPGTCAPAAAAATLPSAQTEQLGSAPPLITAFRGLVRTVLEREARTWRPRNIVILGVDGIPHDLAVGAWPRARHTLMHSVFPTTSASAWLSSLTGLPVGAHGVPGVVFRLSASDSDLVHVLEYKGPSLSRIAGNIFSDAQAFGYAPCAIPGDLEICDCAWTDVLLQNSRRFCGHRFYATTVGAYVPPNPLDLLRGLRAAVLTCMEPVAAPRLIWCYLEVDRHVHRYGYDAHVERCLSLIEQFAVELAEREHIVLAHSDHGLTLTKHNPSLELTFERFKAEHGCTLGGAGRTRWLYPPANADTNLMHSVKRMVPDFVSVRHADELFPKDSLARTRVGDIVITALGEDFVSFPGCTFDHGSLTRPELEVSSAEWSA